MQQFGWVDGWIVGWTVGPIIVGPIVGLVGTIVGLVGTIVLPSSWDVLAEMSMLAILDKFKSMLLCISFTLLITFVTFTMYLSELGTIGEG